ncbi:MAG: hypothetical protein R3234_10975, partial [Thermoanaerobaculia bacterium]|nr:hypothetical protein [Thermoanaerobaculia bacterium]
MRDPLVRRIPVLLLILTALSVLPLGAVDADFQVSVEVGEDLLEHPVDGRLLLLIGTDPDEEPRFQIGWGVGSGQIFGVDVEDLEAGEPVVFDETVFGWPTRSLDDLPAGEYRVQALLHRYDTFERSDGHVLQLPASWKAGQRWNREPGNLYSEPKTAEIDPNAGGELSIVLDREIPPTEPPEDTKYVRHVRIKSELLSEFWGRDFYLGAHVLVPRGFDEHPEARYPLMIFHGHYPEDFGGFRTEPPDPDLECEYSERFDVECYNRIQQEEAYAFYQKWISDDFPRFL